MPGLGAIEYDATAVGMVEPNRRNLEPPVKGLYCNERMVQTNILMVSFQGVKVLVGTKDGRQFSGILCSISPEFKIVLGLTHEVKHEDLPPAAHDIYQKMVFDPQDIVSVNTVGEVEAFSKSGFATDSAISGNLASNGEMEKQLEVWDPDEHGAEHDLAATNYTHGNGNDNATGWNPEDMFKQNAELGVESTFKDDLSQYTSVMPDFDSEEFRDHRAKADAIARQIEQNPCSQQMAKLENDDNEKDIQPWDSRADNNRNENRGRGGGRGQRGRGGNMRGIGGRGQQMYNRNMSRGGMIMNDYNRPGPGRYPNQGSPANQGFDQWTAARTKHRGRDGPEYPAPPTQPPGSDHPPPPPHARRGGPPLPGHPESATLPRANKKPGGGGQHLETLKQFGDNFKLGSPGARMPTPPHQQPHMGYPGPGQQGHPRMQQHPNPAQPSANNKLYSAAASVGLSPRHEQPPASQDNNQHKQDVAASAGGAEKQQQQTARFGTMPNMQVPPPAAQPPPASPPAPSQSQPPGMDQEKTPNNRLDSSQHSSASGKKFSFNPDAPAFTPRSTPGSGTVGPGASAPTTPAAVAPTPVPVAMPAYPPPTPSPAQTVPPSYPVYAQHGQQMPQTVAVSGGPGVYAPGPPMSVYGAMSGGGMTNMQMSYAPTMQQSTPANTIAGSMVSSVAGQPLMQPNVQGMAYPPQQFVMPTYQTNVPQQHIPVQPQTAQFVMRPATPFVQTAMQTQPTSEQQPTMQYVQQAGMPQYIVQQQPGNGQGQGQQGGTLQHPPPSNSNASSMSGHMQQQMQQQQQQQQQQIHSHSNNASQPPTPGPHPTASPAYPNTSSQQVYAPAMMQQQVYSGHPAMGQPMMMYNPQSGYNQLMTATPGQGMQYYTVQLQHPAQPQYADHFMAPHITPIVRPALHVISSHPPNMSAPSHSTNG